MFVSQWDKIKQAFPQTVKEGFTRITAAELKEYIEKRKDELTDSMYLKLLASRKYLAAPGKSIWIIPPDQLETILSQDCGILLVSDPE